MPVLVLLFSHSAGWASDFDKPSNQIEEIGTSSSNAAIALGDRSSSLPTKTIISEQTKDAGQLKYYQAVAYKIKQLGQINFPHLKGKQIYGNGVVYVPIFQDGSIYEKDGGVRIEQSFDKQLDMQVLRIVRRASPFGKFPTETRKYDSEVWELHVPIYFVNADKNSTNNPQGGINEMLTPATGIR